MKKRHLEILRDLLGEPSVAFHEEGIAERVRLWARRRGVAFGPDAAGNVWLRHSGGGTLAQWVFAAHMDHPGFLVTARGRRSVWADFLGSVRREYFVGSRVRLYPPGRQVVAAVTHVRKGRNSEWLSCRLELQKPCDVPEGTLATWDLPGIRIEGCRLSSRGCDDAVGCAAVLCAMDEIVSRGIEADVTGLLTRAEEVGGIGALAACEGGLIPAKAFIIGLEASKAQPKANLGDGVVIRVGDNVRTFDPSLTACVSAVARQLARRDRGFRCVRQLVSGGVCESTIYCLWGYAAAGLCLPLGNYHNMGDDGAIKPEQVHLGDFENAVKLLVALAAEKRPPARFDAEEKLRWKRLFEKRKAYL